MLVTKWTKFKYSGFTKAATSLLVLFGGTIFIWCLLWFMIYGDSTQEEVADSYEYKEQFLRSVHNVAELTTQLKSIEHINELTEDEIERKRLYARYNSANGNLFESPNFLYIVKDLKTNSIVKTNTNLNEHNLLLQKNHVYFTKDQLILNYGSNNYTYELSNYLGYNNSHNTRYFGDDILFFLSSEEYELYAAINNNLIEGDVFYNLSVRNDGAAMYVSWWQQLLMISSVIFAISLIMMAFISGRESSDDRIRTNGFDRIPTEFQVIAFAGAIALMFVALESITYNQKLSNNVDEASMQLSMIAFLMTMIGLVFYCSLIRQIKGGLLLRTSLLGYCFVGIKAVFWRLEGIKLLKPSWSLFLFYTDLGI